MKFNANGQAIRFRRSQLERGSTQKEFAYQIGISERQLRKIERENVAVDVCLADRIANALNAQRGDILLGLCT